jgi:hypothetical protein
VYVEEDNCFRAQEVEEQGGDGLIQPIPVSLYGRLGDAVDQAGSAHRERASK